MESHHYTCHYCQKEFVPKRRKVQKFCSTSCRVRHHQTSKGLKANQSLAQPVQDSKPMEKRELALRELVMRLSEPQRQIL